MGTAEAAAIGHSRKRKVQRAAICRTQSLRIGHHLNRERNLRRERSPRKEGVHGRARHSPCANTTGNPSPALILTPSKTI